MIRLSNSLILSLILHALLLGFLFLSYRLFYTPKSEKKEAYIPLKLHCVVSKTPLKKKEIQAEQSLKKVLKKEALSPIKKKSPTIKKVIPPKHTKKKEYTKKLTTPIEELPKKEILQPVSVPMVYKEKEIVCEEKKIQKQVEKEELSVEKIYMNENLQKIVTLLQENLYYPRRARKRGIEGTVVVRFELSKNAVISSIEVVSSENDILSRGAIRTIENLSQEFPKPREALTISVPISYSLR